MCWLSSKIIISLRNSTRRGIQWSTQISPSLPQLGSSILALTQRIKLDRKPAEKTEVLTQLLSKLQLPTPSVFFNIWMNSRVWRSRSSKREEKTRSSNKPCPLPRSSHEKTERAQLKLSRDVGNLHWSPHHHTSSSTCRKGSNDRITLSMTFRTNSELRRY